MLNDLRYIELVHAHRSANGSNPLALDLGESKEIQIPLNQRFAQVNLVYAGTYKILPPTSLIVGQRYDIVVFASTQQALKAKLVLDQSLTLEDGVMKHYSSEDGESTSSRKQSLSFSKVGDLYRISMLCTDPTILVQIFRASPVS